MVPYRNHVKKQPSRTFMTLAHHLPPSSSSSSSSSSRTNQKPPCRRRRPSLRRPPQAPPRGPLPTRRGRARCPPKYPPSRGDPTCGPSPCPPASSAQSSRTGSGRTTWSSSGTRACSITPSSSKRLSVKLVSGFNAGNDEFYSDLWSSSFVCALYSDFVDVVG